MNKVLNQLPLGLQRWVRKSLRSYYRPYKIKSWQRQGRPIPPVHDVKQWYIETFQKKINAVNLVETGTYHGAMIEAQIELFNDIYSIEWDKGLYEKAQVRFAPDPHVHLFNGDSGEVLSKVLPSLNGTTIFWLDGHYSGSGTAGDESYCPIMKELDVLLPANRQDFFIIVDDAREFNGTNGYPTIEEIKSSILRHGNKFNCKVQHDLIFIFPKSSSIDAITL